jgi:hypothetical protein
MRARFMVLIVALLLGGCGQPDVARQASTTASPPAYPMATEQPYPGAANQEAAEATPDMYPVPLSAEQIARLRATNLPPCPAPTATPVATATWLPTWTPVPPGFPTQTPVPTPSPAPIPGDFKLTLSACVVQDSGPPQVLFSAVLAGGPDNSYEFYCPNPDWQFGDGSSGLAFVDCISWSPDMKIQRTFMTDYTYKLPGTYQAQIRWDSRSGTLKSNVITIEVQ